MSQYDYSAVADYEMELDFDVDTMYDTLQTQENDRDYLEPMIMGVGKTPFDEV